MRDDRARKDRLARQAARHIQTGEAEDPAQAVRMAIRHLRLPSDAPRPGVSLIRKHSRAMSMQCLGEDGYRQRILELWRQAEQIMTLLEHHDPELIGRAARGFIDAGVTVYLRIYSRESLTNIAQTLVDFGYDEPTFATARTPRGCFDRLRFTDEGRLVVLTRCPIDGAHELRGRDLFSGQRIGALNLEEIRQRIIDLEKGPGWHAAP